jgi:beta-glucanase (GH16 family)
MRNNTQWLMSRAVVARSLQVTLLSSFIAVAQTGLDPKWIAYNRAGAGNSSLQCFTPHNVATSGGNLVLTTKIETAACSSIDIPQGTHKYTSAFVAMRSFNFLYGTVEMRAKFGGGMNSGSWPVIWLLDASCQATDPTGTGEGCIGQEIDVAEILDGNFGLVNQQIHIDNHHDGCKAPMPDVSQNFNVYQIDWSPGLLVFKVNGKTTCTIARNFVPSKPMYLKIDVFVGSYGGPVKEGSLPWTTLIDYVKITQGANVIFADEFNGSSPAQAPAKKASPK